TVVVPDRGRRSHDQSQNPTFHGQTNGRCNAVARRRSRSPAQRASESCGRHPRSKGGGVLFSGSDVRIQPMNAEPGDAFIAGEPANTIECLRFHWPEYLMEAAEVGLYLFLTCVLAGLLLYPASPVRHFIGSTVELRALMGLGVGATVIAIVVSPW